MDEARRSRRGRKKKPEERRTHNVGLYLSDSEVERLDALRDPLHMARGEYLRCAALARLPRAVPEINRELYGDLGKALSNLNQLTRMAHQFGGVDERLLLGRLESLRAEVRQVRDMLIDGEVSS